MIRRPAARPSSPRPDARTSVCSARCSPEGPSLCADAGSFRAPLVDRCRGFRLSDGSRLWSANTAQSAMSSSDRCSAISRSPRTILCTASCAAKAKWFAISSNVSFDSGRTSIGVRTSRRIVSTAGDRENMARRSPCRGCSGQRSMSLHQPSSATTTSIRRKSSKHTRDTRCRSRSDCSCV